MSLIRRVWLIDESGPVIRCAPDVDLDALMLEAAGLPEDEGTAWSAFMWGDEFVESPTSMRKGYGDDEAKVGWFRMDPCGGDCGEHAWHLRFLGEERPEGKIARGSWFGVYFA